MASSNQDSLLSANVDKSGFSVPKNLIWIVGGIIIACVVIVMFMQISLGNNQAPKRQQLKPQADTTMVPSVETIERITGEQTDAAHKQAAEERRNQEAERVRQLVDKDKSKGTPLPGVAGGGESFPAIDKTGNISLPAPMGVPQQAGSDPRIEAAARENLIRAAPIMSINESSDAQSGLMGGNSKVLGIGRIAELQAEQAEGRNQAQEKINSLINSAPAGAGQAGPSKGKLERDWLKESATLAESHEPSRGYAPTSRFVLMQGSVINAVLLSAMNTDLPGEVQARVTMDIYDSIRGSALLIPKGTKLIGRYNSDIRVGQDRVNLAFQRMILPNGISVDLPGNIGMDAGGTGGVGGAVNNHYGQMFFVSTLTAIGAYVAASSEPKNSGVTVNTGSPGVAAAGQILGDVNRAIIERNRALGPTITVPAGIKFSVNVAHDIELEPYHR